MRTLLALPLLIISTTSSSAISGIAIERNKRTPNFAMPSIQAMLTCEMSHRVKSSLASVVGLLRVQGRNAPSKGRSERTQRR
jgi:two-component sensor histidine kinase